MFTLKDVRNFFEGTLLHFIDQMVHLPVFQKEMVLYRSLLCWECLKKGRCTSCGCATPSMFFSPNKTDSKGRWGAWQTMQNWQEFKGTNEFKQSLIQAYGTYKGDPEFIKALGRLVDTRFIIGLDTTGSSNSDTADQPTASSDGNSSNSTNERVSTVHVDSHTSSANDIS